MTTELAERTAAPTDLASIVENVLIRGDLSKLTVAERGAYYTKVCAETRLNPYTRPFEYIVLNGKLTLYARKDATDQLRALHGVSVTDLQVSERNGIYIVVAKVTNAQGRTDSSTGVVSIAGLRGDALANAMMKAETKAKRRATLSICGLGLLDELEVDDIADQQKSAVYDPILDNQPDHQDDDLELETPGDTAADTPPVSAPGPAPVVSRSAGQAPPLTPQSDLIDQHRRELATAAETGDRRNLWSTWKLIPWKYQGALKKEFDEKFKPRCIAVETMKEGRDYGR